MTVSDACTWFIGYEREQLPCRVLVSLPHSQLEFSEYMLPNESVEVLLKLSVMNRIAMFDMSTFHRSVLDVSVN